MALLLVAACAFAIFRLSLRSKLNARIEAIRAAGYPTTCAELDKWYAIPDYAENAAYTITEAFLFFQKWNKSKLETLPIVGRGSLPARTEPLTDETMSLAAEYLADNKDALELLHAGAEIEHCRYPVDLSAAFEALLPHLSEMRQGVNLLGLEALFHAENENPQLAAQSIVSALGIAHSLAQEPIYISQLVRLGCQSIASSGLERLVNRVDFTDEQLAELSRAVAEAQDHSSFWRAYVGERCIGYVMFKAPPGQISQVLSIKRIGSSRSGSDRHLRTLILALHRFAGLADKSAIIYLDLMNGYVEASQLPPDKHREALDILEAKVESISKADLLLGELMLSFSRLDTAKFKNIAQLRVAQVALAIQRYRLAGSALPDKLADLAPAYLETVPKDPFDGNELRYKKLESGFVVYSVGEDLSDDGGKEKPAKTTRGGQPIKWDVTFIVER
jgi:hypothetical protein